MTDEPKQPPEPGDEPDIEAEADEIAAAEAEEAEQVSAEAAEPAPAAEVEDVEPAAADDGDDFDNGSGPPPAAAEKGPSKLALIAVALVAVLAGAGTAFALSNRGGSCPAKGDALKVEGTKVSDAEFTRRLDLLRALYDV